MTFTINLNQQQVGNKTYYYITFPFNREIYSMLRNAPEILWSKEEKCYYFDNDTITKDEFISKIHDFAVVTEAEIPLKSVQYKIDRLKPCDWLPTLTDEKGAAVEAFKQFLKSRRYSEKTIEAYTDSLSIFFRYCKDELREITENDLLVFNNEYILKNNFSSSYQNQLVNAIKLFYRAIRNHKFEVELIHRPKREKPLPNVLSKEEVKQLLYSIVNLKHRIMLSMIYACGLRRSELLNLKPKDILSDRGLIHIHEAKGKKDRVVPLSPVLLEQLREYYKLYKPKVWLFEGEKPGQRYGERSIQLVLKRALANTNIKKDVTLHWLRHSYATHLLENGTDLRFIQELLGHKNSKTTEIYTHVSTKSIQNIRSPYDEL